jgi:hypothetical protein
MDATVAVRAPAVVTGSPVPAKAGAQWIHRLHRTPPGRALARLLPAPLIAALRARLR